MKCSSLGTLKSLTGKSIYLVMAPDALDVKEVLDVICVGERIFLEGARLTPERLAVELQTPSLFFTQETIIVREVDKLASTTLEWIIDYAETAKGKPLVLLATALRPGKLQQAVGLGGVVVDLTQVAPWEKERKALSWLKEQGLEDLAARLLLSRVGAERALLLGEVEKLRTYVGEGSIAESAVADLAVGIPNEAIWELGKALLARDNKHIVRVWRSLRAQEVAPIAIVAALKVQMRRAEKRGLLLALFETELKLKEGYLGEELLETELVKWVS
ncbi:MAG: hypothetical protein JSR80_06585 [Verrucomicrobia bacterium]|nr:hypothetical protein [Verrucomicrobiota bacterium]